MLRVLQHYLPVRTALLVIGEALLLLAVVGAGMSQHLWELLDGRGGTDFLELRRLLASSGHEPREALLRCLVSTAVVTLVSMVAIGFNQLYEFHISSSRFQRAARFVESLGTALTMNLVLLLLARGLDLHQVLDFPGLTLTQRVQTLVLSLLLAFAVLYLFRAVYHALITRLALNQRILILGSRGPAHSLARQVLDHPEAGYAVVGMVPEPEPNQSFKPTSIERPGNGDLLVAPDHEATPETQALVLDKLEIHRKTNSNRGAAMSGMAVESGKRLLALVREERVDLLVVALQDRRQILPIQALLQCRLAGVEVIEREEVFEEITGRIAVSAMRPSYLIFNEGFRRQPWADLMKRFMDIVLALVILFLFWPVMLLTALVVKLDSKGPALFRQERVGLKGEPFVVCKFRSMRTDAEAATGPVWSSEDDPRITKVGKFIRKTRLDELPQLFNILGGSMSLVGPRPEREHFVNDLAERIPYFHQRHIVKPGLTGWAQIKYSYGSTDEDALAKLQYDLFYIKNHSVLFDLSILFSTIKTVVLRKGT
ncbi:MAG: lipopolysaccharide/colanic/teichoic acid biosynthesis glycosyltransferase [Planctomycetota bacterium]|jgi:lipopolysaccharide/colanic/teichoic acid biosynthesis glycosyltransferase